MTRHGIRWNYLPWYLCSRIWWGNHLGTHKKNHMGTRTKTQSLRNTSLRHPPQMIAAGVLTDTREGMGWVLTDAREVGGRRNNWYTGGGGWVDGAKRFFCWGSLSDCPTVENAMPWTMTWYHNANHIKSQIIISVDLPWYMICHESWVMIWFTGWWFQPTRKIFVKLDHLAR